MTGSVLVLNASYEYLNVTSLKRAIKLLYKEKAEMIETVVGETFASSHENFDMPSVIRMNYYIRRPFREIALSRRNLLERDNHICQYCGDSGDTIDHIIPRSRGGGDSWTNCVCCCAPCNRKKKNMTPSEAEMELMVQPRKPSAIPWLRNRKARTRKDWGRYLYMSS